MTKLRSHASFGFTIIELIVSIAILLLLVGGLLASYNNYNQNQTVKQAAQTVKANIRLAQSKALSGVKPTSGCTQLAGYAVSFTLTTYSFQAQCTEGLVGTIAQSTLPAGTSFNPVPNSFVFGVVTRGLLNTSSSVTITVAGFNKNYRLTIEPNGVITDNGFQ